MNYTEFKEKLQKMPLIVSHDLLRLGKDKQVLLNQLTRWQKKGLVIQLKRGTYQLNETDRKISPSLEFIANQLYSPSYISLEYALGIYGMIPEAVADVTSVSTKKTAAFKNPRGSFVYQHIKREAFRGYKAIKDTQGYSYFIAEPEKAIVDFFYLNLDKISRVDKTVFSDSYRFQNLETVKFTAILQWAKLFGNKKLLQVAKNFTEFAKKEARR